MKRIILAILSVLLPFYLAAGIKRYKIKVVAEYPHSEFSYTQGLFFHDGEMYESTGMYGESSLKIVDYKTGKPKKNVDFDNRYFMEGSVVMNDTLYLLTWKNRAAFTYSPGTLKYIGAFSYNREGWGITTDGTHLIASDGTSQIVFMDGKFNVVKRINVKKSGHPVFGLNELEYIDGKIWSNVYMSDLIVIIDPATGNVEAEVDCSGLLPEFLKDDRTDVLNGIAYNPETKQIFLTGKYWKKLYEIKLIFEK